MELLRALGVLAEPPGAEQARVAVLLELAGAPSPETYTAAFTLQLYPYASVYLGAEGMLGGEAADRVAGFWRALGMEPPSEPDHLASLLGLFAQLSERASDEDDAARRSALERARAALVWEHLLPWVPVYARKMQAIGDPFYAAWASLLASALGDAVAAQTAAPLPLHLREAPALDDPREHGAQAFIASLLAPVRSGMILVRDDLTRAGREMHLGARYGERRFALSAFFAQDREATLGWLEREARRNAAEHENADEVPRPIRTFWSSRAHATAELLGSLRAALPAL